MTNARTLGARALVCAGVILLANAAAGERGLLETVRARRAYAAAAADLARIRHDNARLRDEIRSLRSDPSTIEAAARRDLGLVRPGEVVIIVTR